MKKFIKKFLHIAEMLIPPLLAHVIKNIFLMLWKPNTWRVSIGNYNRMHSQLIILGNGPSLNESIKRLENSLEEFDCMAVNGFANTQYYEKIKPNMYVLADPVYFLDRTELADNTKEIVNSLEKSLREKTVWKIAIFVPNYGRNSEFVRNIRTNVNISMFYFNMHDHFAPISERFRYFLWDRNWIALAGKTVLNTCVNLGINIIGADTSWHEQLRVDQENNKLYTIDKHFYGEKKVYVYADSFGKVPERLDRELVAISKALSSYWDLKKYAEKRKIKIYNASSYSNIDAFPRKSIKDIEKRGNV